MSRAAALLLLLVGAACSAAPLEGEEAGRTSSRLEGWEPISNTLGSPPNFAQLANGRTMSVVSAPADTGQFARRGAKAGALVELFYPRYAADNLWDSYVGVRAQGKAFKWAHDLGTAKQHVAEDGGLVVSELAGDAFELRLEDVLRPANDAHVRHVVVKNTGTAALENVDVAFYAFYTLKNLPTDDRIRYDAASGALVQVDGDVAVSTVADRMPLATHCGQVLDTAAGAGLDARLAAENGTLVPCTTKGPRLAGVNGVLVHRLGSIAAGETKDITYAIGLGTSEATATGEAKAALAGGFAARVAEDKARWSSLLARTRLPECLPDDAKAVYRRAILTILQHRVDNGAFIAAPTLTSPGYRFVWPRDGSKTAIDLLDAGFDAEAADFFAFLEKLLLPDGSFAVNYLPDGSAPFFDFGREGNENDQPGMLPWGVERVFSKTKDKNWLIARWIGVQKAANHILTLIKPDGLVGPSRDLWELETGKTWTYANGSAVAGLEAAARIATTLGVQGDAARYTEGAKRIRDAIAQRLVTPSGYYARGAKDGVLDERLEIANLALGRGGFGIFPDTDPALAKVGDLVAQRLATPNGGVRRYEGDLYYGGEQWPVAAVWLAVHKNARGDRATAEKAFTEMTRQAKTTGTLMLGEQFKSETNSWVGATPLVWSEAAYTRLAWTLYGGEVCATLPQANDPGANAGAREDDGDSSSAASEGGCGCRTAPSSSNGAPLLLLAALAFILAKRRRHP